jgi:FkbM family methyltransferase
MIEILKNFLKRILYFLNWDKWMNLSWSQEGEDLILNRIFGSKKNGFYIDVGSHHPKRFSNTYFFYKRGWSGINIDAMPGSKIIFDKTRPRDINIELGVGKKKDQLTYYIFNEPALNGFSKDLSKIRDDDDNNNYKIISEIDVKVMPLGDILEKYLINDICIDFLSVDVEGLDFEVLKSNNWLKYKPNIILIEALESNLHEIYKSELLIYMDELEYILFAKTVNTCIFKRKKL